MNAESIDWRVLQAAGQGLEEAARVDASSFDADGFERTWNEAVADLARLVRALGLRGGSADDVLQDTYLVASQRRPRGLEAADLRRWLMRVTANRCRLVHRQQRRWSRVIERLWHWQRPAEESRGTTSDGGTAEQNELGQNVEAALNRLRPIEREVVVLRYFANFDSAEIGELLSMNDATVRSHLVRARKQLAKELAAWGE